MVTYAEAFSLFINELRDAAKNKNIVLQVDSINFASQMFSRTCQSSGIPNTSKIKESARQFIEKLAAYDS